MSRISKHSVAGGTINKIQPLSQQSTNGIKTKGVAVSLMKCWLLPLNSNFRKPLL